MKVIPICPGSAMANCYLIEHEGHALIVDPCVTVAAILRAVELAGATPDGILLTHGHFDHVLTLDSLRDATSAPAYIHESDQILLPDGMKNAFALFFGQDRAFRSADRTLVDGDRIPLGQACVEVIHTPGHTAGSVCYRAGDALLTGDTLFADSFGRYDLYSGDLDTLKASMRGLLNMESDLTIYPGHGGAHRLRPPAPFHGDFYSCHFNNPQQKGFFDMMELQDFITLADLLFPNVTETPAELEQRFPPRQLPEGAKVTRFAPSPTGFVHFGGMFPVTTAERLAHQSGGVFYLRIEDTDAQREIPGAAEKLITTLGAYGIHFDEGAILDENGKIADHGAYGPYKQSLRGPIYHVYAKQLVREGKAYPVFTTREELEQMAQVDKKAAIKAKDWHEAADAQRQEQLRQRAITLDEIKEQLAAGNPFYLRLLADGNAEKKLILNDLVKGKLEIPENEEDAVLLKSDGIPTYHFAHAVDDHLMGTTHVIRGEEWLPSVALHLMLFRYLGFRAPKYMHIAQLMKLDENGSKKKLSKRDMGANMDDYKQLGYVAECVNEYVMTLLNSNYEEWHMQNPDKAYTDFPFSIKKMSASGCLFDLNKLGDISKNVLSRWTAEQIYNGLVAWAQEYDTEFADLLTADPDKAKAIFAIGRGGKKPRKDFGIWSEVKGYMGFFYDKYYRIEDEIPEQFSREDVKATLNAFKASYDESDDMNTWFDKVKAIATDLGYAADMKAYKADPTAFKGNVADISMFLRVAVTGRFNAPDLYTVMHILGKETTFARIDALAATL